MINVNLNCLEKYKFEKELGSGTSGTNVYLMCTIRKTKRCFAAKVYRLGTSGNRISKKKFDTFKNEVKVTKAFGRRLGTGFVESCFDRKKKLGVIVTRLIDEGLDTYLEKNRTKAELDRVVSQLARLFNGMDKREFTHGDPMLFNIGVIKDKNGRVYLRFIDFDRGSVNSKVYMKKFDRLATLAEMYPKYRSSLTSKRMKPKNIEYLKKHACKWARVSAPKNFSRLDRVWTRQYAVYCKKNKTTCID